MTELYKRYNAVQWNGNKEEKEEIGEIINRLYPPIKYSHEIFETKENDLFIKVVRIGVPFEEKFAGIHGGIPLGSWIVELENRTHCYTTQEIIDDFLSMKQIKAMILHETTMDIMDIIGER